MQVVYNTVFEFDLTGKVSFGDLPTDQLYKLFTDGRVASKFCEHHLSIWFPDLEYQDKKGFDHIHKISGIKFDLKGFTPRGACYAPSEMLGAGRKINLEEVHKHAREIDYAFSDISEFPKIRIIFKKGTDLIKEFPSSKIKYNERVKLFS